jgi:hypothetical protein
MVRATVRPLPLGGVWKGLRVTGFVNDDHHAEGAKRQREIGQVSFEHPWLTAAGEVVRAKDQTLSTASVVDAKGYSIWLTPRFGTSGFEALLRHDELTPDTNLHAKRKRDIYGIAYWVPNLNNVTAAVMADYDALKVTARAADNRYGLKLLVNF